MKEANSNLYRFVWAKSIERSKERIRQQIEELWSYTQKLTEEENQEEEAEEFELIDPEKEKQR